MKINKKIVRIILSLIIFISIISVFIVITTIYKKASNTIITENQTEEIDEDQTNKERDFASTNLNINFSIYQKIYIINLVGSKKYFNINEFKYYFILEFNKLGPLNPDINLLIKIDNSNMPTKILLEYKTNINLYNWYFSLE